NLNDYNEFKRLRSAFKTECKLAYNRYIKHTETHLRSNPSDFWNFINLKNKKPPFPNIITYNKVTLNKLLDIIESFAEYFGSNFNIPSSSLLMNGSYPTRGYQQEALLDEFSFNNLEKRRSVHLILFLYDIINNDIDSTTILNKLNFHVPRIP
ncbi:hypothetical protein BDFB_013941, partial [Asbolus verrucosus]